MNREIFLANNPLITICYKIRHDNNEHSHIGVFLSIDASKMKGLAVFLLVASLGVVFAASIPEGNKALPVCPPYDPEGLVVIFPNPDDCTTFYICDDQDRPILKKCQTGLWFNPAESVCDFPENIEPGVCKPPSLQ